MSAVRSANRFRLGFLIALSVALALGSFWVLEVIRKSGGNDAPDAPRVAPDYYVKNFTFVRMAKNRTARYNISGDVLTHLPMDDSYEITKPVIYNLSNNRPTMVMRSERALVNSDNSEVQMIDNVDVDRPASGSIQRFHLKSAYLLLLPDDDVMKTDTPVEMLMGTTILNGTGMVANNATRQLDLAHRVHGVFAPAVAR
ncbi:LPS export ABC transporter periplasmic protein LptC [Actimicrobium sp. CCC2.4]|uniref:LPS export ABC transporter periplasmic protein LptC n=1 Tax=Actimicrobium sp. CCC2.4 TaxID=3048606 RepID=UPI002AC8BAD6|nr:LPS export ABC transporter periplasmic protein LptC [Actimicrobium sp. CCC2.4]MEB0135479.1 LPS export ABC transporter periplasmic protein LptC [Actimicrobium sp. CCC2.4]WPX32349.1 LPS export ABC transporter periplasmic protein LptC [Actimicrobium sp. CCC2.4]